MIFKFLCKTSVILAMAGCLTLTAQAQNRTYTEASELTIVGKIIDTPNPYHRVDTVKYKGFTASENQLVRESSGLSIAFKTNSTSISVVPDYAMANYTTNTGGIAAVGFDLYIKKDGKWLWAASGVRGDATKNQEKVLIDSMDPDVKECLLYLPLYSELNSLKIGIDEGSTIEASPIPFRHRIAIFGSSYTHGCCCSRPGMSYPAQFSRMTNLQIVSLAASGRSKLQPYFGNVLADANVDAFIFDAFSNPSAEQIKERLFPFIEQLQAAHPGKPLIFQRTIVQEFRNFNNRLKAREEHIAETADSMMTIACKKYKDVYYVKCTKAADENHETSVDGDHPSDYGYTLWAESVRKPILKILKKYGIK